MIRKVYLALCAVKTFTLAQKNPAPPAGVDATNFAYFGVKGGVLPKPVPVPYNIQLDEEEDYYEVEYSASASASADPSGSASGSHPTPPRCPPDEDGDGVSDEQEHKDGTDPTDINSFVTSHVDILCVSKKWIRGDADHDCFTNFQEYAEGSDLHDPCSNALYLDLDIPNDSVYGFNASSADKTSAFYYESAGPDQKYADILHLAGIEETDTLLATIYRGSNLLSHSIEVEAHENLVCGSNQCKDTEYFPMFEPPTIMPNPEIVHGEQKPFFSIPEELAEDSPLHRMDYVTFTFKNINIVGNGVENPQNVPSVFESLNYKVKVDLYFDGVIATNYTATPKRFENEEDGTVTMYDAPVFRVALANVVNVKYSDFTNNSKVFYFNEFVPVDAIDENGEDSHVYPELSFYNSHCIGNGFRSSLDDTPMVGEGACITIDKAEDILIKLNESTFEKNIASKGGVMSVGLCNAYSEVVISGCSFVENMAKEGSIVSFTELPFAVSTVGTTFEKNGYAALDTVMPALDTVMQDRFLELEGWSEEENFKGVIIFTDESTLPYDVDLRQGRLDFTDPHSVISFGKPIAGSANNEIEPTFFVNNAGASLGEITYAGSANNFVRFDFDSENVEIIATEYALPPFNIDGENVMESFT